MSVPKSKRGKSKVEFEMTNAVENYAGQCQKVTEGHRAAVNALATIAEVEAYDYTVGYPPKINFDTYFG